MSSVKTETRGSIRLIRFQNPPRGYLTAEGSGLIMNALKDAAADPAARVIVFTGTDEVFIRHYDVGEIVQAGEAVAAGAIGPDAFESGPFVELCRAAAAAPKPVIAAINGVCMGGGFEFSLACDLRVASANVDEIGLPETRVGIFPGGGGTQRLPRLIGEAAALEFILRGTVVDAREALSIGLVHEIAVHAEKRALEIAEELAGRGVEGLAAAKALVRGAGDRPIAEGLKAEQHAFHDVLKADSAMSAMRDFLAGDQDITR
ncbi:MAG: enoyl-CoA hydratase/isomerase family protein [Pseudomonadota bacterium]